MFSPYNKHMILYNLSVLLHCPPIPYDSRPPGNSIPHLLHETLFFLLLLLLFFLLKKRVVRQ
jgi:hypothetical protein